MHGIISNMDFCYLTALLKDLLVVSGQILLSWVHCSHKPSVQPTSFVGVGAFLS